MVMFSVIFCLRFYTFPENLSFQSGFTLSQIGRGVLGGALVPRFGLKLLILAGFYRHN